MNLNKLLIVANWKCNPVRQEEAQELFNSIKNGVGDTKNAEIVICPPFVYLSKLTEVAPPPKIKLGGQDCFWEQSGPFTGEISPQMLKNLGCEYVILGHSERRQYSGETDEMIAKKLKASLEAGLKPIFCIGETLEQKRQEKTEKILSSQLKHGLDKVSKLLTVSRSLFVAYEPIWAIGAGNACSPDDAKQVLSFLKQKCNELRSRYIPILYGGSVDSKNAKEYINVGFDGLLIGGASLDSEQFIKTIKILEKK